MKKKKTNYLVDKEAKNCCNIDSYGEICVGCGLCEKRVQYMVGVELKQVIKSAKIL